MPSFVEISPAVPEKKILSVFTIYGYGIHLGLVTRIIYIHIDSPFLLMLHIKFGFEWWKMDDGQTPDACISDNHLLAFGSGELKIAKFKSHKYV